MPPINMNELPRLFFLYAHLMAFAITMSAVLTEDYRLLTRGLRSLREGQLRMTMKIVVPGLLALIVTGLGIAAIDTGMEWDQFLSRPKLLAKMCVVLVLVANGLLLHYFAFPRLTRPSSSPRNMAAFFCLLCAISAELGQYCDPLRGPNIHSEEGRQQHPFLAELETARTRASAALSPPPPPPPREYGTAASSLPNVGILRNVKMVRHMQTYAASTRMHHICGCPHVP